MVEVTGRNFKNGVGEIFARIGQEPERVAKNFFSLEFFEKLPDRQTSGIGFDVDEFLRRATLVSIRRRDGVGRRRSLNRDAVDVGVDRPPKVSSLEDDESVIEIPFGDLPVVPDVFEDGYLDDLVVTVVTL